MSSVHPQRATRPRRARGGGRGRPDVRDRARRARATRRRRGRDRTRPPRRSRRPATSSGLDRPLPLQIGSYFAGIVSGDWGVSLRHAPARARRISDTSLPRRSSWSPWRCWSRSPSACRSAWSRRGGGGGRRTGWSALIAVLGVSMPIVLAGAHPAARLLPAAPPVARRRAVRPEPRLHAPAHPVHAHAGRRRADHRELGRASERAGAPRAAGDRHRRLPARRGRRGWSARPCSTRWARITCAWCARSGSRSDRCSADSRCGPRGTRSSRSSRSCSPTRWSTRSWSRRSSTGRASAATPPRRSPRSTRRRSSASRCSWPSSTWSRNLVVDFAQAAHRPEDPAAMSDAVIERPTAGGGLRRAAATVRHNPLLAAGAAIAPVHRAGRAPRAVARARIPADAGSATHPHGHAAAAVGRAPVRDRPGRARRAQPRPLRRAGLARGSPLFVLRDRVRRRRAARRRRRLLRRLGRRRHHARHRRLPGLPGAAARARPRGRAARRAIGNATLAIAVTWWPWYARLVPRPGGVGRRAARTSRAAGRSASRASHDPAPARPANSITPVIVQASLDVGGIILTAVGALVPRARRAGPDAGLGADGQPGPGLLHDPVVAGDVPGRWRS